MGTNLAFLKQLQRRIAQAAIGPSSLRKQGASKVIARARTFVNQIDLAQVSALNAVTFVDWLDATTDALVNKLPSGARHWGSARKAVNLFLRDAVYNQDLALHFQLDKVRPWLEVPLDQHVRIGLRGLPEAKQLGRKLPGWTTIKKLTPEISAAYQQLACRDAENRGVCRVDVDVYYWRAGEGSQ